MEVFPGDPEVEVDVVQTREETGWELRRLVMGSHAGTHVDAFSHTRKGGADLDQIPLSRFYGEAICIDVIGQPIPVGPGLIYREHVPRNLGKRIIEAQPTFVGGPSLDEGLERDLLGEEIVTFDGLVNLEELPAGARFIFCGFPLRIRSGDGSPVRAVAIFP